MSRKDLLLWRIEGDQWDYYYEVYEDYPVTSPWMKQVTRLRIIHSGD